MIENQCNCVIEDIVVNRGLDRKFYTLLSSHNTTLPTIYTLIKTHKVPSGVDISIKELEELKVRPIVSCSGSPNREIGILSHGRYNSTPELHSLSSSKYTQALGNVTSFNTWGPAGLEVLHGRCVRSVYQCQRGEKHLVCTRSG